MPLSTTITAESSNKPTALFLNCTRLDYDRNLDFGELSKITDFRRNDVDAIHATPTSSVDDEILHTIETVPDLEILILKEITQNHSCICRILWVSSSKDTLK